MSGNHSETSNYKKEVLIRSGFQQYLNTTIFLQGNIFILSPAVSKNKQGYFWFDIREKNINRYDNEYYTKFIVVVRIVNIGFIVFNFSDLEKIMATISKNEKNEKNGGKVWSFVIQNKFSCIINRKANNEQMQVVTISEQDLIEKLDSII